jgi:hypothetical protein
MPTPRRILLGLFTFALLAACGSASLVTPEALPVREYFQDRPVELTLVMKNCSNTCVSYEAGTCKVSLEGKTINLEIDVPYSDKTVDSASEKDCSTACGPPVLAHCTVGPLNPGTYTVQDGGFHAEINVH